MHHNFVLHLARDHPILGMLCIEFKYDTILYIVQVDRLFNVQSVQMKKQINLICWILKIAKVESKIRNENDNLSFVDTFIKSASLNAGDIRLL